MSAIEGWLAFLMDSTISPIRSAVWSDKELRGVLLIDAASLTSSNLRWVFLLLIRSFYLSIVNNHPT